MQFSVELSVSFVSFVIYYKKIGNLLQGNYEKAISAADNEELAKS
jgi:hypothetical protein